jgi:hypothetical protein
MMARQRMSGEKTRNTKTPAVKAQHDPDIKQETCRGVDLFDCPSGDAERASLLSCLMCTRVSTAAKDRALLP